MSGPHERLSHLQSFEFNIESMVLSYSSKDMEFIEFRAWLLSQNWPPFNSASSTCQLGAAAFWFLRVIALEGNENYYRNRLERCIEAILHGTVEERQIWETILTSNTYEALLDAANDYRIANEGILFL